MVNEMVRSPEEILNFHKSNSQLLAVKLQSKQLLEKLNFNQIINEQARLPIGMIASIQ